MSSELYERIATFVQEHLGHVAGEQGIPSYEPQYRWEHTLRVANYGKHIAEQEGLNAEVVVLACLLHDVAAFERIDPREQGQFSAEIAREFLQSEGCSTETIDHVCYAIAAYTDVENPVIMEAAALFDADSIDRLGALRTIQWVNHDVDDYYMMIIGLQDRMGHLMEYRARRVMYTNAGHELFNNKLDRQIAFFETLIDEAKLTRLP